MQARRAILDDYQNAALTFANRSKVENDINIRVFNEHLGDTDKVAATLDDFPIEAAGPEASHHDGNAQRRVDDIRAFLDVKPVRVLG